MPYFKSILTILFCFISCRMTSQNDFYSLGESTLSLRHEGIKSYGFDFVFRSRYFLYKSDHLHFQQQQIDIFHFSNFKLNSNYKVSAGIYYRNRDLFETGDDELRFLEQMNYSKKNKSVRFEHRFRSEQRILEDNTIFRQRYRFALDLPLNNEASNSRKTLLTSTIEGLLSLSKTEKPETDVRISTLIGWQINNDIKLQTGLEHRLEAFNMEAKNNLFVLTSAIIKI